MSWLTFALVGVALVFWLSVFAVVFREGGGSFLDYLRGELEPLPEDLGTWRVVNPQPSDVRRSADESGATIDATFKNAPSPILRAQATIKEQRLLLVSGERLVCQTRYRDRTTGLIVGTEPEETVVRRRARR